MFPVAFGLGQDALELTISTKPLPILILLEPGIIVAVPREESAFCVQRPEFKSLQQPIRASS